METAGSIIVGILLVLTVASGWGYCFLVGKHAWEEGDKNRFVCALLVAVPLVMSGIWILLQAAKIFLVLSGVADLAECLDNITIYVMVSALLLFVVFEIILYHRVKASFSHS